MEGYTCVCARASVSPSALNACPLAQAQATHTSKLHLANRHNRQLQQCATSLAQRQRHRHRSLHASTYYCTICHLPTCHTAWQLNCCSLQHLATGSNRHLQHCPPSATYLVAFQLPQPLTYCDSCSAET